MRSDKMSDTKITVGFIGCGNMGGAIAKAVAKQKNAEILIAEPNKEQADRIKAELKCKCLNGYDVCERADFIFLAIKPNLYSTVVQPLKDALDNNPDATIITIAAGISIDTLEKLIGSRPIIRIMPNTPVTLGCGMIAYCKNELVTENNAEKFKALMSEAGRLDEISESLIDAESAVAGCGPAFVYMFIEALADGGVECGLPRDRAMIYAAETLKGASEMVLGTGKHPGQLKDEVCSPGGSTIEGVRALEAGAFRATVSNAVVSAYEKTKKLGKV